MGLIGVAIILLLNLEFISTQSDTTAPPSGVLSNVQAEGSSPSAQLASIPSLPEVGGSTGLPWIGSEISDLIASSAPEASGSLPPVAQESVASSPSLPLVLGSLPESGSSSQFPEISIISTVRPPANAVPAVPSAPLSGLLASAAPEGIMDAVASSPSLPVILGSQQPESGSSPLPEVIVELTGVSTTPYAVVGLSGNPENGASSTQPQPAVVVNLSDQISTTASVELPAASGPEALPSASLIDPNAAILSEGTKPPRVGFNILSNDIKNETAPSEELASSSVSSPVDDAASSSTVDMIPSLLLLGQKVADVNSSFDSHGLIKAIQPTDKPPVIEPRLALKPGTDGLGTEKIMHFKPAGFLNNVHYYAREEFSNIMWNNNLTFSERKSAIEQWADDNGVEAEVTKWEADSAKIIKELNKNITAILNDAMLVNEMIFSQMRNENITILDMKDTLANYRKYNPLAFEVHRFIRKNLYAQLDLAEKKKIVDPAKSTLAPKTASPLTAVPKAATTTVAKTASNTTTVPQTTTTKASAGGH